MSSPTLFKLINVIHRFPHRTITEGGHRKILATLISVVFSGLIFASSSATAASKYPCENLSGKECYIKAKSWSFPTEMSQGLKGLKAERALAKANSDKKRYDVISGIYKKIGSKYKSLKAKAAASDTDDNYGGKGPPASGDVSDGKTSEDPAGEEQYRKEDEEKAPSEEQIRKEDEEKAPSDSPTIKIDEDDEKP